MALSNSERQDRYQKRIRHGELSRIQVTVPDMVSLRLKWLCRETGLSRTAMITQLIDQEWNRQEQPTG